MFMNVVKGVGVARPPQQNMKLKILIWVAELVIELLKANGHETAQTLEENRLALFKRSEELASLKQEQALLEESLSVVRQHNSVLEDKIKLAKISLGELKAESDEKTLEYMKSIANQNKTKLYIHEDTN